ncbi:hypothetical protein CHLNCDRAFT_141538 [Chlorella variabilis]|uniref:Uncharacterized protein n=1 Tax=Chlorella variabilis TaxID=554065 RepID=E1ZT26_CHLVA|nr:hypothetical protein CHLNCDRAFT_141538 [Chlorella variabilis]EFN51007.1 hypothetical protein CHLNCDRAFT_141538 [Chlorella variabilis]|eukprot:XP_005843109.1 hypothetical protein CHLNCDRAFT_141538 [Chlorella variabilis]
MEIEIKGEHGYVFATVLWDILLHHFWMSTLVVNARKKYNINYPNLYAPPGHKDRQVFDCIQYPVSASIAGFVYLLGRIVYFLNYSSGRPQARYRGAFMHVAYIALLAMVVRFTIELLLPMVKDI